MRLYIKIYLTLHNLLINIPKIVCAQFSREVTSLCIYQNASVDLSTVQMFSQKVYMVQSSEAIQCFMHQTTACQSPF